MFKWILNEPVENWGGLDDITVDFLSGLLNKDPLNWSGKTGIDEIMKHEWFKDINFELIKTQSQKAPYVPDETYEYIDDEFSGVDVRNAN